MFILIDDIVRAADVEEMADYKVVTLSKSLPDFYGVYDGLKAGHGFKFYKEELGKATPEVFDFISYTVCVKEVDLGDSVVLYMTQDEV